MVTFSGPNYMIPNQRSHNPMPILKEDSSAHQSGNPWWVSEDYSRTPTTWTCRSWVGNSIQDYSKGAILRGITLFQSVVRAASTSAPLGKFNWSIQVILKYPVWPWPNWANSVPEFRFQDGQNCIGPIQTIQPVTHLSGSAFQLFTYTGHLFPS
ncbi:hypothetical protein O181_040134 [Austropuccinia psidii MF-1]|uniref:Uncharacterized protein n=1 Tax=Austropuccinia psidii MF-1 TaxID=1389203 RepID=A0A9Q3DBM9_9BASI|nr:hypothetical protein [Austropuccinia psidii MF-1]